MAVLGDGKILLQGNPIEVTEQLRGKVWRKIINYSETESFEEDYNVISKRLLAGRTVIHVLDENAPEGFEPAPTSLEDVYFSTLHRHQYRQGLSL
jgi:hypothetical protein